MQVQMILVAVICLTVAVCSAPVDRVKRQFMPRNFMLMDDLGEPCEPGDCPFDFARFMRRGMTTVAPYQQPAPRRRYPTRPAVDYPFAPPAGLGGNAPARAPLPPPVGPPRAPPAGAPVAPPAGGAPII